MPVAKAIGSKVTAGTLNQTGSFVMTAERFGADTLLAQIVHMVAAAQRSRAPIQRTADRVAGWESAGVTLLKGDLRGIVRARRLSRATMRNIRQNLFLSFVYNVAGMPPAAGVLYPFFSLLLSPEVAAAAMALSSVSVIAHALRLKEFGAST